MMEKTLFTKLHTETHFQKTLDQLLVDIIKYKQENKQEKGNTLFAIVSFEQELLPKTNKKALKDNFQGLFLWQREKDSNPHIQSQSLLCYPYTIPLFRMRKRYYTCFQIKVKIIFVFLPLGAGVCYNDSVKGRDPHE